MSVQWKEKTSTESYKIEMIELKFTDATASFFSWYSFSDRYNRSEKEVFLEICQ